MVSPDEPPRIKTVNPSLIKMVKSLCGISLVGFMDEKLRTVRSMDGQAPAPMPSRELMEVRSFDDESVASLTFQPLPMS